jgi:hypothetical protein
MEKLAGASHTVKTFFAGLDTDKDGALTAAEWDSFRERSLNR